jgi:hypothetical protein
MEHPFDRVDNHIDDFICVWKHGWDISCFSFDRDPIYDIKGNFQLKNAEIFPLEDCFPYMDNQDIWKPNDDMITYLFHPPGDGLLHYTCVDFHPYLGDYLSRWISVATHLFQLAQNSFLAILVIYYFQQFLTSGAILRA